MDYLVKNESSGVSLSKVDHDFRLAEIIIRIGTTKITTQVLECSLCDKNFYLGHTETEHFLVPVTPTSDTVETTSVDEPLSPSGLTIVDDEEDDEDTVDHNVLTTNGSLVYRPEQPECPATLPVVIGDGANFEPPPPEPLPTIFEPPEPALPLPNVVAATPFASLDQFEAQAPERHSPLDDPAPLDVKPKVEELVLDLTCTECGLKFKTVGKLKRHVAKEHKLEKHRRRQMVCEICDRVLADRASMQQHMDIHLEKKNFKCTHCGRLFRQKNNLIRHTRIHTGEKPHLCTICGKGFYDKTDLTRHFRVHTGERPYKCTDCPRSFSTPGKLKGHKNTHSGEANVQCPVCHKKLSCNYTLKSHLIMHTGQSSSVCTVCDKVFAKDHKLKRHMMTHTDEKPFVCPTCGNRFRNRYNMTEHMKIHDREKVKLKKGDAQPLDAPILLLEPSSILDGAAGGGDDDVEHHIHLPTPNGLKIGILQTDRKLTIDDGNGDYIEINYEDIQLGLGDGVESDAAM